jgi:chromatin remodeling complex protein RSC6
MPRKSAQSKKSKTVQESKTRSSRSSKTAKPVKAKPVKAKTKAKTKTKKVKEEVVEEPELSDVETEQEPEPEVVTPKKKRCVPTKESVVEGFDDIVAVIDEEIARLRETQTKSTGVKFLRSLGKRVKTLRGHTVRVMKQKQKTNRKNNTNSGFLKPVQISKDMAKFTGWDHDQLRSRVDVTKYICNYIRENDLQNPEDRRQILADKKLAKLLEYSADKDEKPLTYYRIQTYMKKHFTNPPKTEEKDNVKSK